MVNLKYKLVSLKNMAQISLNTVGIYSYINRLQFNQNYLISLRQHNYLPRITPT